MSILHNGTCIQCGEIFDRENDRYITYGGGVWCSENCLAEWCAEHKRIQHDIVVEKIEESIEVKNG